MFIQILKPCLDAILEIPNKHELLSGECMSADEFSAFILARQKELKLSVAELSRRSGLSRQSLYRLFDAEVEQTRLSTFVKLGIALELHPLELMRVFFCEWQFPDTTPARTQSTIHNDVSVHAKNQIVT